MYGCGISLGYLCEGRGQNRPEERKPTFFLGNALNPTRIEAGDAMAVLDWSKCPAVESIPGKVSGAWVFRGTRLPVATVFENLEDGMTIEEVMEQFDVTREQIQAVLEFAARSLDAPVRH